MSSKQTKSPVSKPASKLTKAEAIALIERAKKDLVECDGCGDRIVHRDDYGAYKAGGFWCSRYCAYGDIIDDMQNYR